MNIIFILIDALRYDVFVNNLKNLHSIQLLRENQNTVFYKFTFSPAGWTLPAISAIFSGMYPGRHGASHLNSKFRLLQEYLNEEGYISGYCSSNPYFSGVTGIARNFQRDFYWNKKNFYKKLNFSVIFKSFLGKRKSINRKLLHNQARKFILDNAREKFFLYMHHNVHAPYQFYRSHIALLKKKYTMQKVKKISEISRNCWYFMGNEISKEDRECLFDLYKAELLNLDIYLSDLFNQLQKQDLYDNSMIIITSDHGEHFGEYGVYGHNFTLYEEIIRVPLIIKYPKEIIPKSYKRQICSTIDVMPTILDMLNITYPDLDGSSLLEKNDRKYVISERSATLRHYEEWREKHPKVDIDKWNYYILSMHSLDKHYIEKVSLNNVEEELYSVNEKGDYRKTRHDFQYFKKEMQKYKDQIGVDNLINDWLLNKRHPEIEGADKAVKDQLRNLGYID